MAKAETNLQGKTALITGAARGIGAGVAESLHARGANVALVGLEPERLEALAGRLDERALWHEADATDAGALGDAVDAAQERFGGIDVAIANAGVHWTGSFAEAPIEQLEREIEINLLGVLRTDRAVLPALRRSRGYLLNVASLAAASHTPLLSSYTASKAGVEALSDSLRQELAAEGVGVGCAYFGFIDTDMVREAFAHPSTEPGLSMLPSYFRRPAPVEEAVGAIVEGVLRRRSRIWAPRYVGPALMLRGILQPLTEWRTKRSRSLRRAVELAAPDPELDLSGGRGHAEREPAGR